MSRQHRGGGGRWRGLKPCYLVLRVEFESEFPEVVLAGGYARFGKGGRSVEFIPLRSGSRYRAQAYVWCITDARACARRVHRLMRYYEAVTLLFRELRQELEGTSTGAEVRSSAE